MNTSAAFQEFLKKHPYLGSLYRVFMENGVPVGIIHINSIYKNYNDSERYYHEPNPKESGCRKTIHTCTYSELNDAIRGFKPSTPTQQLYIFSKFSLISNEDQDVIDNNVEILNKNKEAQLALF